MHNAPSLARPKAGQISIVRMQCVVRLHLIQAESNAVNTQDKLVRLQHSVLKKLPRIHCLSMAILALAKRLPKGSRVRADLRQRARPGT